MKLYSNRKYSYTSLKEGQWKFQGDGGWQKQKFLKKNMQLNWKFWWGGVGGANE